MAGKWTVEYRKGNCSGWLESPRGDAQQFICYPDGMIGFDTPEVIPERVKSDMRRHCWSNCRAPKWRRPGAAGLRGCGCGARRK
jgi:hypothetical protein